MKKYVRNYKKNLNMKKFALQNIRSVVFVLHFFQNA